MTDLQLIESAIVKAGGIFELANALDVGKDWVYRRRRGEGFAVIDRLALREFLRG